LAYPTPINRKQLQSFLGLAGYYRKFIPHYAHISAVYRVQLGRQTTVTAGMKSGPLYRPDAAMDCSRLTKCKHALVTEKKTGAVLTEFTKSSSAMKK